MAYDPSLYALVHRGTPGDRDFYRRETEGVASVLELGCGFGRLLDALTQGGARYTGLDLDTGLLALAEAARRKLPAQTRRGVRLVRGDMRSFQLPGRFARIVIPHTGLFCLPSQRDVLQCLMRVRAQLADDGELLLDTYNADDFHASLDEASMTGEERDFVTRVNVQGVRHDVFERTRWHKRKQQLVVRYEYERDGRVRARGLIRHHYLLRAQLEALLVRAGLVPTQIAGSFRGTRYTRRSAQLVVRARRA